MNNMVMYVAVAAILAALVGCVVKQNAMTKLSGITKKVSVVAVAFVCMFATACGTSDNEEPTDAPEQNIEDTTKEDETEQETPEENVEEETNLEEETPSEEEQKQEEATKDEKETKVKEEKKKETPKKEEVKKEAPKKEEAKKEEPKKEEPKKEAPKKEEPKKEAPKQEAPKQEAPKKEEPAPAPAAPEVKSKYKNGTFSGTGDGFQGPITVNVTINNDQITGISVASHSEDDPFWSDAKKVIDSIISAQSTSVNAVSGATFSSNGIKQAVGAALNSAKN